MCFRLAEFSFIGALQIKFHKRNFGSIPSLIRGQQLNYGFDVCRAPAKAYIKLTNTKFKFKLFLVAVHFVFSPHRLQYIFKFEIPAFFTEIL
jgi:hypothetical protein